MLTVSTASYLLGKKPSTNPKLYQDLRGLTTATCNGLRTAWQLLNTKVI